MKKSISRLSISLPSLALALVLASCGRHPDETAAAAAAAAPAAEPPSHDNIVSLTPENLKNMTLQLAPAEMGNLGMTLKAAGRISANGNRTAKVTPTLEGRVTQLNFDLNDPVPAGAVVALVESPELLGKPLELKAPLAGVIMERAVTVGEQVAKGQTVYTISDPTQLWAIAEVKERDLAAVKPGQAATFTTLAYPGETFSGQVTLIGNQVETGSRTVEVRIAVDNPAGRLKPGMFADVEIVTTVLENILQIPDHALETDGENQVVFVALAPDKFEKRIVKLGQEQGGRVQILAGLKAGENIVTEGGFILKSELLKGQLGEE